MPTASKSRLRGRPIGTYTALSPRRQMKLVLELRDGAGPVNLSATAKEYGISRSTLLRCIDIEPGLREAIEARRQDQGRGYVPVKRGTRATRAAAKEKLLDERAAPSPRKPDRVPPPEVRAGLARGLDDLDSFERWMHEMAADDHSDNVEVINQKVQATLRRSTLQPEVRDSEALKAKVRAAFRPFTAKKRG